MTIVVRPQTTIYEVLLTTTTAVSHHDPAVQDDSNRSLFNRQTMLLDMTSDAPIADWGQRESVSLANKVPLELAPIAEQLSFSEFVATALVRLWLDIYNRGDGTGLFEGAERYQRLETRLRLASIPAGTLRALWDRLCRELQVPIHAQKYDEALFDLCSLPLGTQQNVLRVLSEDYRSTVSIARFWHQLVKNLDADYAERSGSEQTMDAMIALDFPNDDEPDAARTLRIEAPSVSANSVRHQMVREPAMLHLMAALGLDPSVPGQGPLPAGVEMILNNGGNIAQGAKQPSNVHKLQWQIRGMLPSLDLVGGVTDTFDLGESRLDVATWVVCKENADGLDGSPAAQMPRAHTSIFDMLDDVTLTRGGGTKERGQMVYSFETLAKGAQILCRFALKPFTPVLSQGALVAAIDYFLDNQGTIGGQSARGFGQVRGEWVNRPNDADEYRQEYEDYLAMRKTELVSAVCDGTLGADKIVCS